MKDLKIDISDMTPPKDMVNEVVEKITEDL